MAEFRDFIDRVDKRVDVSAGSGRIYLDHGQQYPKQSSQGDFNIIESFHPQFMYNNRPIHFANLDTLLNQNRFHEIQFINAHIIIKINRISSIDRTIPIV